MVEIQGIEVDKIIGSRDMKDLELRRIVQPQEKFSIESLFSKYHLTCPPNCIILDSAEGLV